jgi:hypothetical protein
MAGPNGFTVDWEVLDGRQVLHVRQFGYQIAYCRTPGQVAEHVPLVDLVEVIQLESRAHLGPYRAECE